MSKNLFEMSDEELKVSYLEANKHLDDFGQKYLDEFNRRAQRKQAYWMFMATVLVASATVANVVIAISN